MVKRKPAEPRKAADIYGGADPRDMPAYTLIEAAHHLRLPPSTIGTWCRGRGRIIVPAKVAPATFSFFNMMEAHVLAAIRRKHRVAMPKIRRAVHYLSTHLKKKRPLIDQTFRTDGVDLFVEVFGEIVSASQGGQQMIRQTIELALERVEVDVDGLVARLYPWANELDEPKLVVIDPRRAFGRPVVVGTNVPAQMLAERFAAGDGIAALSDEYFVAPETIEYVIRWARVA